MDALQEEKWDEYIKELKKRIKFEKDLLLALTELIPEEGDKRIGSIMTWAVEFGIERAEIDQALETLKRTAVIEQTGYGENEAYARL
jgi:hypothetical protein